MEDQELVDALEAVWQSIVGLCRPLTGEQWATPTDCPGWSVQDNVAHLIAIESMILGRPQPAHTPPAAPHVKNDIGRFNEVWVDWYRSRTGAEVLGDFEAIAVERIAGLRALDTAGFDADSWTPMGPGTVRTLLPFRIFDSWVHEQDIRRALGIPGGFDNAGVEVAMARMVAAMPYVVGKKVKPADGTVVVFDVQGPAGEVVAVGVVDGRAQVLEVEPDDAHARLTMTSEAFLALTCGRWDTANVIDEGVIVVTGDDALARAVVAEMNVLF